MDKQEVIYTLMDYLRSMVAMEQWGACTWVSEELRSTVRSDFLAV